MTSARNLLSNLKPSGSLKIVALLSAIAIFSVVSYATSVSVSTTTYQSQYGVSYNVTGAFTAADRGFQVATAGVAVSALLCTWGNNGTFEIGLRLVDDE